MPIRPVTYRDLSTISSVFAEAFREESFHAAFFPHRNEFPDDFLRVWRQRFREEYWNYRKTFALSYEIRDGQEVVTGAVEWTREGDGWESLWGIWGWWDPRLLIHPLLVAYHSLHRLLFHNRAAPQPTLSDPKPLTYWTWEPEVIPFTSKYFIPPPPSRPPQTLPPQPESKSKLGSHSPETPLLTPPPTTLPIPAPVPPSPSNAHAHMPFYTLQYLAVHPAHQNQAHGRALTQWGLALARAEQIPAVVIAADKREAFYRRCGFTWFVGWASEGAGNPLRRMGVAGGAILWTED